MGRNCKVLERSPWGQNLSGFAENNPFGSSITAFLSTHKFSINKFTKTLQHTATPYHHILSLNLPLDLLRHSPQPQQSPLQPIPYIIHVLTTGYTRTGVTGFLQGKAFIDQSIKRKQRESGVFEAPHAFRASTELLHRKAAFVYATI